MRLAIPLLASLVLCMNAATARAQLLSDGFSYPNGLITNEFAYHNPTLAGAKKSANWEMTSGSLFASNGAGWTGVPDDRAVNAGSTAGTNSAVFRMDTVRKDFGNVAVSFKLLNQGLTSTRSTPPTAWDGCHVWLRYQSQYNLYYASINRRDNTVIIKKKVAGGPSNGGTYYNMSPSAKFAVPYGQWQNVRAEIFTNADDSVTIRLFSNGRLVVQANDNGTVGGAPIRGNGGVGIRGDNANLKFDDFVVTSLGGNVVDASAPVVSNVRVSGSNALWTTNEPASSIVEWGRTTAFGSRSLSNTLTTAHSLAMTGLTKGLVYYYRVTSRNAAGKTTVTSALKFTYGGATTSPTSPTSPTTSPSIVFSGVGSTDRTTSSADIVWTTNVAADSQVEYGLTSSYGLRTGLNTTKVTSHRLRVAGLKPGTRYYYRVRSGGVAESVVHAFVTAGTATAAAR